LVERQFITILFANVNVSGFVRVGMKLLNIETLVTRNTIKEILLNMQDYFCKVGYARYVAGPSID
jgi:hypothetical protein